MNKSEYQKDIDKALNDEFLRSILDTFAVSYKENRKNIFADTDIKQAVKNIIQSKTYALEHRQELYEQFKAQAEKKGAKVIFARTAAEANALIADIAQEHKAKTVVKSKSMTSEEIRLNHSLAEKNIQSYETDLGEWICQLRGETPSHMVLPSIHLSRQQVAHTFEEQVEKVADSQDITELVRLARRNLRKYFVASNLGITGANFCIAESGTVGLATNEGNDRLITTLPENNIVLCGLDKIVAGLQDAMNILEVLSKNATAQYMTSFVSFISGAEQNEDNSLNPNKRLYIIVLDNGRSAMLADPLFAQSLNCIRCGACANVCPVFRLVGGHRMGYIYVGAIGLILTYFFHGEDKAKILAQNCINCGACKEVCSADIDLPAMIEELRLRMSKGDFSTGLMSKVIKNRKLFHSLLKFARFAQIPLLDAKLANAQYIRHLPSIFDKSLGFRTLPAIAEHSFRELFPKLQKSLQEKANIMSDNSSNKSNEQKDNPQNKRVPKLKVAIFGGCLQDFVYPEDLQNCTELLYSQNIQVDFPLEQNCCGLPVLMLGQKDLAKEIAENNILAFADNYDYIISLCASCASHIKFTYPKLYGQNQLSDKIMDFSSFVVKVLGLENLKLEKTKQKVAYHSSCHLSKKFGVTQEPRAIIQACAEYIPTAEEDLCCGFGGTYSVKFPTVSANILQKKLYNLQKVKEEGLNEESLNNAPNSSSDTSTNKIPEILVADCPGCVMQLKGAADKNKLNIQVRHISWLLKTQE